MNRLIQIAAAGALCLLVAQQSGAVIALSVAQGALQSVSTSHVTVGGKTYAVDRNTVVVGAKSLGQIPVGAHVAVVLSPDGKVMRLVVQRPGVPLHVQH